MRDIDQHKAEWVNHEEGGEAVYDVGGHGSIVSARHLEQSTDYPEAQHDCDPVVEPYVIGHVSIDHRDNDDATHWWHYNFGHKVPAANVTEQAHDVPTNVHYNC